VVDVERRTFGETIVVFNLTAFQYSTCLWQSRRIST